jgi:hypothetical protein
MKLVSYANLWHRIWSVRFALLALTWQVLQQTWLHMPPEWRPALNAWEQWVLFSAGSLFTGAAGLAAIIHQDDLKP